MADLYDRLDEIQGMTRVLTAHAKRLATGVGDRSVQAEITEEHAGTRRVYVRAVFSFVEAIVEQHKRLLLDLASNGYVTLNPAVREALAEQVYVIDDNGSVSTREQYVQLRRKLRAVYRAAGEAFGTALVGHYDGQGWQAFDTALKVRDRITHPKSYADCDISGDDLVTVDAAEAWFRKVNSEFVRVAREHRSTQMVGRVTPNLALQRPDR